MASILREVAETFSTLAQGFSVTFRNMFRKTVTENYPYEPVHFQPRYRGIHVLHRDENGLEKCVGCFLCGYCVEACPTDAITHGHGFELATYDINSLVYRKEQLLEKESTTAASPSR